MNDNARPHRVPLLIDYVTEEGFQRIEYIAYFSNLFPIENVWGPLGGQRASLNLTHSIFQLQGTIYRITLYYYSNFWTI